MKRMLVILALIVLIAPFNAYAYTAIDEYGNEYEVYEEEDQVTNSDHEDKYANMTYTTTTEHTTVVTEAPVVKEKSNTIHLIILGVLVVAFLLGIIFVLMKAIEGSQKL